MSPSSLARTAAAVLAGALFTTCRDNQGPKWPLEARQLLTPSSATSPGPVTLVGAGNIARCDRTNDEATANLLDGIPGTVFALGDAAYPNGTATNYANCYNLSWGRHKSRTYPALGNHDYDSSATAVGYFGYFGVAAGDPTKGYYSYDLGTWHVIVLNSNDTYVSTAAGWTQEQWLKTDLAATTKQCVLAMWHRPRFYSTTSSTFSPSGSVKPFWDDLYAAGADLVVNAHMRDYERFAPQTPSGAGDAVNGIREIIVGTGGEGLDSPNTLVIPNSEVQISGVYGVLSLTLGDGTYSWQFIPVAGQTGTDSGNGTCHHAAPVAPATPFVSAGPDLWTHPLDTLKLSVTFSDPGSNDAPWAYAITWGDGGSSTGITSSRSTPITASHVYTALGLDSIRVSVANSPGLTGWDTVAVQVVAPATQVVFVGAGDIADCTKTGDSLTANLLDTIPGTVFVAGDNAYPSGSSADYTNCYGPTWGRHKARTRPVPGNHEYSTPGATGYFGYFRAAAGDPAKGYYSYDLGDWHIVALNSSTAHGAGSPQETWLKADLAASTKRCTLAYMHHPLFSSGTMADTTERPLWQDLYAAGADVVVAGHDHNYQRFAPQTPTGVADPISGIREFVAGMGGAGLYTLGAPLPNSQVQSDQALGVLKLTLSASGYDWKFIPVAGKTFMDAGSGTCHDAPSAGNRAPTAAPGGPYPGSEGTVLSFDASGSSDPDGDALSYNWSFGDGSAGSGVKPSHTYANNAVYTVTLTVTDARGASSAPGTTTATIANAGPTVNAGPNQTVTAGSALTVSANFSDPGVNDAPWSYAFDLGDGSPQTAGSTTSQAAPVTATHTYQTAGNYTVQVTVTDRDGASGLGAKSVTVSAAAATARTVFTLGDNVYPSGSLTNYQNCYNPSWGRHKARTAPALGNHEYDTTPTAADYFTYFGAAAGDPTKGYYGFDLGAWHIVALNSDVSMSAGSPQEQWLRADLAAHAQRCSLAYWHHPRFSSGSTHGSMAQAQPLWQALYDAGAEIVLSGHEHNYERFAPQTPSGAPDLARGIREFVVGTGGGAGAYPFGTPIANSEVRITGVNGVLKLALGDGTYAWQFIPVAGQTATDSGSGTCH